MLVMTPGFCFLYRLDKTSLFIPRNRFETYFSLIALIVAKITYFSEYITEISSIFKRVLRGFSHSQILDKILPQPRFSCVAAAKLLFYLYEHRLALVAVVDGLHQAVEGAAAVGDAAHLGVAAHEDAALGVLGGVAAVDADPLVVGHADEQGQPTVEAWAKRYYYGITAFGDGGLALGLAASVVEVDPMRFKGVTEIGPRGEHSALTAADAEATDGIGRSLRDAFQMEFYHDYKTLPASLKGGE